MQIAIKNLTLRNFKGIKNFSVNFTDQTDIFGDNASGKTTLFDAFLWLLFGKDSTDRKDFNIKTLDRNNNAISKLEHEVSGAIQVDGQEITLKRIFREKWVKKRGESQEEFTGHETEFFYNDVPLSQAEYKGKIDAILKEDIFKLITSSVYYNGLKWQDRRDILMQIAGEVTDKDVLAEVKNDKDFTNLMFVLGSGKSLTEYRREIAAKKKIIRDNIILIPARIDEVKRSRPEPVDKDLLESKIKDINHQIAVIEGAIANKNEAYQEEFNKIQEKQQQINDLVTRKTQIVFEVKTAIQNAGSEDRQKGNDFANQIRTLELDMKSKTDSLTTAKNRKESFDAQLARLRADWKTINESELKFDDGDLCCPTCKRELDDVGSKKEELKQNFLNDKNQRLSANRTDGQKIASYLKNCEEDILSLTSEIEILTGQLTDIRSQQSAWVAGRPKADDASQQLDQRLADNDEYVSIGTRINTLEGQVQKTPVIDLTEFKNQKAALSAQVDDIKKELHSQNLIDQIDKRVSELEAEEKSQSQEITNLELTEFLINDFDRTKMDIIESRIKDKFKYVSFKMFNRQINGGSEPTCETLINGVPYSDANNAARINAGIDIINALCEYYQVWAPIFIDNRESVTELIDSKSQLVNLVVLKGAKLSVNKPEFVKPAKELVEA